MRRIVKYRVMLTGILIIISVMLSGVHIIRAMDKEYEYDDSGRVTKVIYEDGSYETYEYDKNGNIVQVTYSNSKLESSEENTGASDTGDEDTGASDTEGQDTEDKDAADDELSEEKNSATNDVTSQGVSKDGVSSTGDGKLTYYGESTLTAGVIEAKGDFVANNSFVATDMHKVIFSGDNEQIVSVSDGGSFNEVEIRNYTSGGITIQYSFNYAKLTDNNCVLNYAKLDGERGYTLTEDTEIDGSYYLVSDELNLNGCTMTINGDLIQSGGTINVNGGR